MRTIIAVLILSAFAAYTVGMADASGRVADVLLSIHAQHSHH